jgi:hypothetical protein
LHVDFAVNIHSGGKFDDDAIPAAVEMGFAIGNMGDLRRALALDNPSSYIPPQAEFILRGLRQHSAVESYERIGTNKYRFKGKHWPTLIMIDLNDYELTSEAVRHALDENAPFDLIVATNANRGPLPAAVEVARYAGKRLVTWREFYSDLNKPWT